MSAGARRVLLVEDQADLADSLRLLLERRGHTVECACDGGSALEAAARFAPEVVLLDIGLPDMSGLEVARRLREEAREARPRLIALSAVGPEFMGDADWRSAGFDDHVRKPVRAELLCELLRGTLPADASGRRRCQEWRR